MDTTTEKQELIDWIRETNDETLIQDLRAIKGDRSAPMEWNDLSEETKASVRRGMADIKAGRSFTSEEMWAEFERRRSQKQQS